MTDLERDAIANAVGPILFLALLAFPFVWLWLTDEAAARKRAGKIGPHVVGPDDELYRVAKDTRLNGDVWYCVERWNGRYWWATYAGEFRSAEEAQAAMDARFEHDRARLTATREPVSP
jgi:hypothetical protein